MVDFKKLATSKSKSKPVNPRELFNGRVLEELVVSPGKEDMLRERCEVALVKANLKPDGLRKTFLVPFAKATKGS